MLRIGLQASSVLSARIFHAARKRPADVRCFDTGLLFGTASGDILPRPHFYLLVIIRCVNIVQHRQVLLSLMKKMHWFLLRDPHVTFIFFFVSSLIVTFQGWLCVRLVSRN